MNDCRKKKMAKLGIQTRQKSVQYEKIRGFQSMMAFAEGSCSSKWWNLRRHEPADSSKHSFMMVTMFLKALCLNSLPNDKILDWTKFKAFADDKINGIEKMKCVARCWLPSFSPFPRIFSEAFFFSVVKNNRVLNCLPHQFC